MADVVQSLADTVGTGIQDGPICLLPAACPSSTSSGPIIPSSDIAISTTLPSSDVSSTTSRLSSPIPSPPTTTSPSPIHTSLSPASSTRHSVFVPPTSTQSTQPTSPPVNIGPSASSAQPKSITTTLLSTSGAQVVTITSVIENPAAILNQPNDNGGDPNSFMSNRAAVIGVFTAVGITVLVLFLTLVLYIFRKRQARRQLGKDRAAAAAGARRFLDDEDELGNEKGWWHGDSGTSLAGAQPVHYNSGPLDYARPYVGTAHPYASAAPTPNRTAPPVVDTYSSRQAPTQTPPDYGLPSTSTTNAQRPPSTTGSDMSSFGLDHAPQPPGQSTPLPHVQVQESSGGSTHPYASLRRHTANELLAGDVLAQQSPHHGSPVQQPSTEIPGTETVGGGYSLGHLGTSTSVVHPSPFTTASDLFTDGSRGGSADQEQWYDDTDSESHAGNRKSGLVPLPPPGQQDVVERAEHPPHDPRFSGVFGPEAAWVHSHLHHPRDSVDAGTICEEDQGRFRGNGRVLTIANA